MDPAPVPHQLEKWDPDPHKNVLDPPHWFKVVKRGHLEVVFGQDIFCCLMFSTNDRQLCATIVLHSYFSSDSHTILLDSYTLFPDSR